MNYIVDIYQRGGDLVFYRGVVQGQPVSFTRVTELKKVHMNTAGDYIDVIYLDADKEYSIGPLGKGHYSYDEVAGSATDIEEIA